MTILMMLILPIREHGMCFDLFVSSLSSFSVLQFSKYRPFTSLVRFIPTYCILFEAIVNEIVFLISCSVSSLLAYKNATDFWLLIFHPATLLNSFLSSSSFLVESLVFSVYSIMLSADKDRFTSSFPIWMPFISSFCLIAVARTSSTMLNRRGESGHPCLVLYLKGNGCSFYPLSMMLAVGLSYMAFIMFRYVPTIPTLLRVFILNG
uniref:Putative reverse transcriptase-like protein n=1 Tax=Desmodus rotundus TaxID=9430 RepID=K9IHP4_DESRO